MDLQKEITEMEVMRAEVLVGGEAQKKNMTLIEINLVNSMEEIESPDLPEILIEMEIESL